jgi:opacity protein-like surface antigen
MNAMNKFAVIVTAALLTTAGHAQTTTPAPRTTASNNNNYNNSRVPFFRSTTSIRDNPGVLGHSFADLNYSWVDYHRDAGIDADGYIAGLRSNVPVVPGLDIGLGYNYYRENNHRNPFTGTPYDARYHEGSARATLYTTMGPVKPFMGGGVGYQWSRGDIQTLRTFDHEWVWNATAGFEAILGYVALTPRVSFADTIENHGRAGLWSYGAQLHHWFNEQVGGYLDATFNDPRSGGGVEWWTYTAGLRLRF